MDYPVRMVSIDPGTNSVGIAVCEFSADWTQMVVVDATTIDLQRLLLRYEKTRAGIWGDRRAKLYILREAITRYLDAWRPVVVCSEAPYMGRFPQAFAALVEAMSAIAAGVSEYDPSLRMATWDPASVKQAMGVNGRSGDKELMRRAITLRPDIVMCTPIELLDEHAVDAICVGYTQFCNHIRGGVT